MFSTYFFRKYFLKITLWLGINYHQPNLLEQGRQGVQNDVIIGAKTFYLFFFFLRKNEEKWENCSCSFEPSPSPSPSSLFKSLSPFIDLKILSSSASHSQIQIALIPEKNVWGRSLLACLLKLGHFHNLASYSCYRYTSPVLCSAYNLH